MTPDLVDADAAGAQRGSELLPRVVEGLVEGAAGRVEPLGEHVDRDAVERERDQHLALVRAQLALDRFAEPGVSVVSTDFCAVRW